MPGEKKKNKTIYDPVAGRRVSAPTDIHWFYVTDGIEERFLNDLAPLFDVSKTQSSNIKDKRMTKVSESLCTGTQEPWGGKITEKQLNYKEQTCKTLKMMISVIFKIGDKTLWLSSE